MRIARATSLLVIVTAAACGGELPRVDPASRLFGVNVAAWWRGVLASTEARGQLARAREAGLTDVAIVWTGYQSRIDSFDIADDPQRTPSREDVVATANAAHELGLRVHFKPHVDLSAQPDRWRGEIGKGFSAAEWERWFAAYGDWLVPLAGLARDIGAETFFAGTELSEATRQAGHWFDLVARLRVEFPGRIAYDANWDDEAARADFGPFDLPAVSAYWPLSDRCDASDADIAAGWGRALRELERLAWRTGKPVLVGEVGYASVDCGTVRPWDWSLVDENAVDGEEQASAYRAVVARAMEPWLAGILFWYWHPTPSTAGERFARDYPPQGKPAAAALRER